MFILYLILVAVLCTAVGVYVGARLNRGAYHGYMVIEETEQALKYHLDLAGDPELLQYQDTVTFKVVPPDYEALLSRGKRGV